MAKEINAKRVLVGNLNERDNLEDLDIDRRTIRKWISRRRMGAWTGLIWLRIRARGRLL